MSRWRESASPWIAVALVLLVFFAPLRLQAWAGGILLFAVLFGPWLASRPDLAFKERWRLRRAKKRALELDWTLIDNTIQRDRLQRDCERPETLGVCTGRECLVYDSCDFNIKRILP